MPIVATIALLNLIFRIEELFVFSFLVDKSLLLWELPGIDKDSSVQHLIKDLVFFCNNENT